MIMTFNQKKYEVIDVSGRDPLPSFSLNKVALQKNEVTSSVSLPIEQLRSEC